MLAGLLVVVAGLIVARAIREAPAKVPSPEVITDQGRLDLRREPRASVPPDRPGNLVGELEQLRSLIDRDHEHRALYQVFLDVRNAAAKILESTSIADIANPSNPPRQKSKRKKEGSLLPMVVHGNVSRN